MVFVCEHELTVPVVTRIDGQAVSIAAAHVRAHVGCGLVTVAFVAQALAVLLGLLAALVQGDAVVQLGCGADDWGRALLARNAQGVQAQVTGADALEGAAPDALCHADHHKDSGMATENEPASTAATLASCVWYRSGDGPGRGAGPSCLPPMYGSISHLPSSMRHWALARRLTTEATTSFVNPAVAADKMAAAGADITDDGGPNRSASSITVPAPEEPTKAP